MYYHSDPSDLHASSYMKYKVSEFFAMTFLKVIQNSKVIMTAIANISITV